jgi:hypothetical protein
MERRQIGLKLVMDQLGLPVQVESFDDRLVLQKAIYLAQAAGVKLGYYYRWYLRGPYCPAVAEDGFAICAETSQGVNDAQGWQLDATSTERLAAVRRVLGTPRREDLPKKLELLASVHYLVDRHQVPGRDPKTITDKLRKFEKPFVEREVTEALGGLTANGIL